MVLDEKNIITALVDEELTDAKQKSDIISRIKVHSGMEIDYKVQSLVKNLVKEKIIFIKTPDNVKAKILKSIGSDSRVISEKRSFLSNLFGKPSFSFATVFVVVLAVALIILNRPGLIEKKDFEIEQIGDNNMFVQAKINFKNFLDGRIVPQFTSSNTEQINAYFRSNGVQYSTIVPVVSNLELIGAVVLEDKGVKFPHLVYEGSNDELAYLFQVDEIYFQNREIIFLTDDLIKYLNAGNCYSSESDGLVIILTKVDNNICAIVGNGDPKELAKTFCSLIKE